MPKGNYEYVPKQGRDSGSVHKERTDALIFKLESGDKIMTQVHHEKLGKPKSGEQAGFKYLNYLDKFARMILSVCHSMDSPDFVRQNLVDMNTVAVAPFETYLVIACSGKMELDRNLIMAVVGEDILNYGFSGVMVISQGAQQQHAEMQIVDFFSAHSKSITGKMIGVSKPCCILCAQQLDALKVEYSYWHDQNVGKWIPPLHAV